VHRLTEGYAEIHHRGPDPGIRIKWLIGKADLLTLAAAEPFDTYVDGFQLFPISDDCKLLLFYIIPGEITAAPGAGISCIEQDAIA
jgi:hypothetical protein